MWWTPNDQAMREKRRGSAANRQRVDPTIDNIHDCPSTPSHESATPSGATPRSRSPPINGGRHHRRTFSAPGFCAPCRGKPLRHIQIVMAGPYLNTLCSLVPGRMLSVALSSSAILAATCAPQEITEGSEMEGQHKRLPDSGNRRSISPLSPFPPVQSQTHEPTGGNGGNGGGERTRSPRRYRDHYARPQFRQVLQSAPACTLYYTYPQQRRCSQLR